MFVVFLKIEDLWVIFRLSLDSLGLTRILKNAGTPSGVCRLQFECLQERILRPRVTASIFNLAVYTEQSSHDYFRVARLIRG